MTRYSGHLVVDRRGNGLETSGRLDTRIKSNAHRCDSRWHARVSPFTLAPYRARLPVAAALSPFSPAPAASRPLSSPHSPDNVIHSALLAVNQLVTLSRKSSPTKVSCARKPRSYFATGIREFFITSGGFSLFSLNRV